MSEDKSYKNKQQDLTELNSDGNRDRGSDGEDLRLTQEEEERLKEKLKKLREKDPFIYR